MGFLARGTRIRSTQSKITLQIRPWRITFSEDETAAYIAHHLRSVNLPDDLFTTDAVRTVFLASRGILREINNICLLAILKAKDADLSSIDSKLVKHILDQRELN